MICPLRQLPKQVLSTSSRHQRSCKLRVALLGLELRGLAACCADQACLFGTVAYQGPPLVQESTPEVNNSSFSALVAIEYVAGGRTKTPGS